MDFFRWTNHFFRIDLVDDVLDGIEFSFSVGQNIGFDEHVVDYKTDISCKDLVVVFNHLRTKNLHIIFLKHLVKRFHFFHHISFYGISPSQDML